MNEFVIVTDSAADLSPELIEEMETVVIPLTYNIQGRDNPNYPDHREMDPHTFYELLRRGEPATTAAINVSAYTETLTPILEAGKDILLMVFSSGLSTTYQSALIAAEELREAFPQRVIRTVDTLCASLGQGLLVWHACRKRGEGLTLDEVCAWAEENKLHLCHWFTVDDLNHLKRGGRVSAATALLGTMLSIKPVLHVDDEGHLINMSKVRGRAAALSALVDQMENTAVEPAGQTVFISHGDAPDDARLVAEDVKARFGVGRVVINTIGPVIGAHSGPGTIALFFLGTNR
ncbi:MAG: DegV family protein [Oscillospiraceae bacterium]|nr:DegV family protein [Oscillospiraceae bacterium]